MPIQLPASFQSEIERPHGSNPMVCFVELQLAKPQKSGDSVLPPLLFRVCDWHTFLAWPTGSPTGETWYPFNFTFSPVEQNKEGDLPQLDLTVDNSTRTLQRYLHNGEGFEGNYCHVYLVPANGLAIAHPNHEFAKWELQVAGCTADDEAVTFRLERANFFSRLSPVDRYGAQRCRWRFGSEECGYVINEVAAYTTCPKTLDACIDRGQDHLSRGLPVVHPRRFGGFPGIPRQR